MHAVENGTKLTANDQETAEALQDFFKSVLLEEGDFSLPSFEERLQPKEAITGIEITPEAIKKELTNL